MNLPLNTPSNKKESLLMKEMLYTPLDIHVKSLLLAISCRVIFCKPFIKKDFVTAILILLKFYHSFLYLILLKYHHSFLYKWMDIFSFLLHKVFVAASKPIKAKRNKKLGLFCTLPAHLP